MAYKFPCLKCKVDVISDDEADFDGQGFCVACKIVNQEVAKKVDEQIGNRRASGDKTFINRLEQIRTEHKTRNKRTIQYMNI